MAETKQEQLECILIIKMHVQWKNLIKKSYKAVQDMNFNHVSTWQFL